MTEEKTHEVSSRRRFIGRAIAAVLLAITLGVVYLAAAHKGWFAVRHTQQATAQNAAGERKILYWYDPMHPAYTSNKPGIAPDCGMALVPKYADESASQLPAGAVTLDATKQAMAGVRTTVVRRTPLTREIVTTAQIVADESRISHVHVKLPGFIEQVYVSSIGQLVHKGDRLFTYYSPELVAAEEEYLIARRGGATLASSPYREVRDGSASLLSSSRQKLKLLDLSDEQIRKLEESGEVARTVAFYSPVAGFVTDRKVFPQSSATPEMDLYTLSDLSSVWALADIYESELPYVRLGQRVTFKLSYAPGKTYAGAISFIYPNVDAQTRTAKVRVQLPNRGFALKTQMFAEATIHVDYGRPLLVPQEAVLNSGTSQQVYVVHEGGVFEPRTVTIGPIVDGQTVILSGLKEGETVVSSGNYLIDSDSRLKNPSGGTR
ncbi:MAG: efflux RND transporter periplasmic adaptor subunit [Terracidiphilus sp.]|nr:efflux RND transporter periplasmic adaptor subunit [Terracidiphilus sp.]